MVRKDSEIVHSCFKKCVYMLQPVEVAAGACIDDPVDVVDQNCPIVVPKGVTGDRSEEFMCWGRVLRGSRLTAGMNFVEKTYRFDISGMNKKSFRVNSHSFAGFTSDPILFLNSL
jgi:hypothetical protein